MYVAFCFSNLRHLLWFAVKGRDAPIRVTLERAMSVVGDALDHVSSVAKSIAAVANFVETRRSFPRPVPVTEMQPAKLMPDNLVRELREKFATTRQRQRQQCEADQQVTLPTLAKPFAAIDCAFETSTCASHNLDLVS